MNCQEALERAYELVTGNHPAGEAVRDSGDDLQRHLEQCPNCRHEFDELQETWALVGLSAGSQAPPAHLESQIIHRLHGDQETAPSRATAPASSEKPGGRLSTPMRLLSYAIAASVLFVLVGAQAFYLQRISSVNVASRDPDMQERLESLENAVAELERLQNESQSVPIQFVSFQPGEQLVLGQAPKVAAHAIWNGPVRQLHFFGYEMRPLDQNHVFAIWFAQDETTVLGRSFQPDAEGKIDFVLTAPEEIEPDRVIMTIEPLPLAQQPSKIIWSSASLRPSE